MKYRIARRAERDLESVGDYIAQDNPDAADRWDDRIHAAIELLAANPGMGHNRVDVRNKNYRFWAVGNYVIAYRMEGRTLIVVRVLHGARDFRKIFR